MNEHVVVVAIVGIVSLGLGAMVCGVRVRLKSRRGKVDLDPREH